MDFKARLKAIRGSVEQEDFARIIGVKLPTYGRWERGEQEPKLIDINKILLQFSDINPAWLLTGKGEMRQGKLGSGNTQSAVNSGGSVNQGQHDGDVYIYNSSPEPHAAKPEIAELVVLLDRYANKALLEDLKGKLLNIKKVMEG